MENMILFKFTLFVLLTTSCLGILENQDGRSHGCKLEDEIQRINEILKRSRRHVETNDLDHQENTGDGSGCLDKTDPLYYISKYHKEVCASSVRLAFDIFYEREPSEAEEKEWFEKCENKEVDEAYMMWIFSSSDEHVQLLQKKRLNLPTANENIEENKVNEKEGNEEEKEETLNEETQDSDDLVVTTKDELKQVKEILDENSLGMPESSETNKEHSSSSKDDDVREVSEAVVPLQLKMTNQEFSESLGDPESDEYQELSEGISHALADILSDIPGFKGVKVLGFGEGSIIVYWTAIFDEEENTSEDKEQGLEIIGDASTSSVTEESIHQENYFEAVAKQVKEAITRTFEDPEIRAKKLENTVLASVEVEPESIVKLSDDVAEELEKKNPNAVMVTVEMIEESNEKNKEENGINANSKTEMINSEITSDSVSEVVHNTANAEAETLAELEKNEANNKENYEVKENTVEPSLDESSKPETVFETESSETNVHHEETMEYTELSEKSTESQGYEILEDTSNIAELSTNIYLEPKEEKQEEKVTHSHAVEENEVEEQAEVISGSGSSTTEGYGSGNQGSGSGETWGNIHPPVSLTQTVCLKLRVTNMNFSTNLTDRNSQEFQVLENKFLTMLYPLMKSLDGFLGMEVIGFGSGSLVVNNEIFFKDHVPANISDDVKDRINAAHAYFKYSHIDIDEDQIKVLRPEETDLCEFVQCSMFADCVVRTDFRAECQCRPGYISVDSKNCIEICDLDPGYCRNGGKCHVVPGRGAVCRCQVAYNWAYEGDRCEEIVPRTVLLVSASTAVACLLIIVVVIVALYVFCKRRNQNKAKQGQSFSHVMTSENKQRDSRRYFKKKTPQKDVPNRVNPIFNCDPDSSSSDIKHISSSSSSVSSSSSGHRSTGSTSTSSFFAHSHLGSNGPLPGNFNTPERFLHLKIDKYPQHKLTWHKGGGEDRPKRTSQWRAAQDYHL